MLPILLAKHREKASSEVSAYGLIFLLRVSVFKWNRDK